nr:Chain C, GLN-LEU-PRO-ARG-LEU-PHE-PRO-LEU-LEU [Homo sapiens]7NMD_F Chain F, GLN-LEU-PRO-ARG-LEU-PHE-PRO-LEU-LEU [Homo sapiens]7NME_C Chain C, GLN-LEU-PRO-ARG-LEU-PHE-PRO-LEU-LEU [Homo sapiens]7NMF_C Chain C, GLN-LEU-PRO-ARG-LEU-PHE-PRO-LEU-LEU [Homo sapiens]
QLPRLFPLL